MRIIIDTNVFVSGIFWGGPPYKILKAWQEQKVKIILSEEILAEYDRISKALLKKYSHIDLSPIIELLAVTAEMYVPLNLPYQISRDPDDDKFIACALAANARFIISGDKDLLILSTFKNIKIISPAEFVKYHL